MNLLSFNFDSCAQSHPHNLRAFEVKKNPNLLHRGAQTPTNCKKSRNENEFQMKAKKKADSRMNFQNEKAKKKTKKTSFKMS